MKSNRTARAAPAASEGRRAPRQDRAQATVNAILAGAARVLVAESFEGINTNAIAAAAGVSIGTLYQYFANKDDVVMALIDRHCEHMTAIFMAGLAEFASAPLDELVRGLVGTVLAAQRSEQGFFRVLREQVPRTSRFCKLNEVLDQMTGLLAMGLAARAPQLRVANPQQAAFVVVHAVDGILDAALSKGLDDDSAYEAMVAEVGDLLLLYLQGSLAKSPASP